MAYTVKNLSRLSGVTVRTLHYYEEIGLLHPAYHGENGYRYYEEKQLLDLQQILFFKELGFTLKQIKKVLGSDDFSILSALFSHKRSLVREKAKIGKLIKTVDKTIKHLKGDQAMNNNEIFDGFKEWSKGKGDESYCISQLEECKSPAEKLFVESTKKPYAKSRSKEFYEELEKRGNKIFNDIVICMDNGLKPDADKVQSLIKEHHSYGQELHTLTKKVYKALAELFEKHPTYKKQVELFDLKLPSFMAKAMNIFADKELS